MSQLTGFPAVQMKRQHADIQASDDSVAVALRKAKAPKTDATVGNRLIDLAVSQLHATTGLVDGARIRVRWVVVRQKKAEEEKSDEEKSDEGKSDEGKSDEGKDECEWEIGMEGEGEREINACEGMQLHALGGVPNGEKEREIVVVSEKGGTCQSALDDGKLKENGDDEKDEDEEEEVVWWPAVIRLSEEISQDADGRYIWEIHYESFAEFPAEVTRVVFVEKRTMSDLGQQKSKARIRFIAEGEDEADDEEYAETITMTEFIEAQERLDREQGDNEFGSAEELMVDAFERLPILKQMRLASGFRKFSDSLQKFLAEKREQEGVGVVVTADMIRQFFAKLDFPRSSF